MTPTEIAALAAGLRLLSLGFTKPDEESLEQLRRLTVFCARHAREEDLAELLGALEHELDDDDVLDELAAEYEELFGGAARIAPYESSYEDDPRRQTRRIAEIEASYRAFGRESGGPAGERADHAGCELEFLALLVAQGLEAAEAGDTEHVERCREAERAFLRDHLACWFPGFCRDVAKETLSPVYRLLALVGERLVGTGLGERGVEPLSRPIR